jgi:pyridoxamine 5'-phosphate oxidase family protein
MGAFTDIELDYLRTQRLGRLATADSSGRPHVVPVTFRYDQDHDSLDVGGHQFARGKKYRDVQQNPHVAFVVDDWPQPGSGRPRGVEVRGEAEILPTGGKGVVATFDDEMLRIRARRVVSWGLT